MSLGHLLGTGDFCYLFKNWKGLTTIINEAYVVVDRAPKIYKYDNFPLPPSGVHFCRNMFVKECLFIMTDIQ